MARVEFTSPPARTPECSSNEPGAMSHERAASTEVLDRAGAGARRRVHFDQPEPLAKPREPYTVVRTATIPAPRSWNLLESTQYGLHGLVWWARRMSKGSRDWDARCVCAFIEEKGLWDPGRGRPSAVVSAGALKRYDITRQFYWIDNGQIDRIANALSAVHRLNSAQPHDLKELMLRALFPKGNYKAGL